MSVVSLHVWGAEDLLRHYREQARVLDSDARVALSLLAAAEPYSPAAASSAAPNHLRAIAELCGIDGADLAWRIAYVQANDADGVPIVLPTRDARLERLALPALIDMLAGDDYEAALNELAIRAVTDPRLSEVIAHELATGGVADLRDRIEYEMYEVAMRWDLDDLALFDDGQGDAAIVRAEFDLIFQAYGTLLGSFSHHESGLAVLESAFHIEHPDDATNHLPVALLHGDWDEAFLYDLYERIFTDPSDFHAGFGRLVGSYEIVDATSLFPRLVDPHTVLLEAIGRQPDLARRLVLEEGAFRRLMEFDSFAAFGGPNFEHGFAFTRMNPGQRLGDGLAALFDAALLDPARTAEIYAFLGGQIVTDEDGYRSRQPGLLAEIAELGLASSPALRQTMAEVWNLQWHNLAHLDVDIRPTDEIGGAVLAEIFRDNTARLDVMAGFGAFLEVEYAGAFAAQDGWAEDAAGLGVIYAFEHVDHALDTLQLSTTDRSLLRTAFRTGAGFGAKQALPFLGGPPSWGTVAAGFVVSEVISEIADRAIPDQATQYPSSRSVLHDLFVEDRSHGSVDLPSDAEVLFAQAAMAGRPDLAAGVEPSRWLVDGVIVEPTGDEVRAYEDFALWFGENFTNTDSPFLPIITPPAREIAGWLATDEFLES